MRTNCHIHSLADVHPESVIGDGSHVGPFCVIEKGVILGERCQLQGHVVIKQGSTLGNDVTLHPFVVVGGSPQHLKYKNEPTRVEIGSQVTLRESVTVHRGTEFGGGVTRIGAGSFIMAYSHVAHDCQVGREVILANASQLAGHVEVEDFAFIGGLTGIVQFCRVGRYCFVGGSSMLRKDLPPFLSGKGNDFRVKGVNVVGLSRRGFSSSTVSRLKHLFKIFYLQNLTVSKATDRILCELGETDEVKVFLDFLKASKVGFER